MGLSAVLGREHLDTAEATLSATLFARKKNLSDEKIVCEIIRDLVNQSARQKEQYWEPAWMLIFYFFMGHQQINFSRRHKRFWPALVMGDRRLSTNLIQSRVLTIASQDVSSKPQWETVPTGNDAISREQARVGLDILRSIWHESEFLAKRVMLSMYRALFGIGFAHPHWDPMRRIQPPEPMPAMGLDQQPLTDEETGKPQLVADGRGKVKMTKTKGIGDINIDTESPFDLHFSSSTHLPLNSSYIWAAIRRARPTSEIYSRWKKVVKAEKNALDVTAQIQWELGNFFEEGRTSFSEARAKDSAYVIEYMEPPSTYPGFERGITVKVSGDKMLEDPKPSLLRSGRIPIFPFPLIPVPLTPWGTTPAMNMREPQMAFNKQNAMLAMAATNLGMPNIQMEDGQIPEEHLTDGNRIWSRTEGTPPLSILEGPRMNAANVESLKQARENLNQAGGIGAYTMGQPLGSSPQPVGTIQLMQEADTGDLTLGQIISTDSMARLGEAILDIAREKYTIPRMAYVIEENEDPRVFKFSRRDIPEGLKVRVQEASALPHIKEAQQQKIMQMMSSGVLTPIFEQNPGYMKDIFEIFEMPTPDWMENIYSVHKKKQERELRDMIKAQPPPNPPFVPAPLGPRDDHAAHLEVLDRYINSLQFEGIPPEAQQAIMMHTDQHQKALEQQQMQQMQQQMQIQAMMQGGGGPPPEGGGGQGPPQ